jgi:polar amino acid transport system substrate-binding protein
MNKKAGAVLVLVTMVATSAAAIAQPSSDPRIADLVRAGKVRIAMHLPQFTRDPVTGAIRGLGTGTVIVQIAEAIAGRMGVGLELVGNPSPPALVDCLKASACDLGFLGYVPGRTGDVGFTPPHIMVPFTYLVPAGSQIHSIADADRDGMRIAVVRSHVSTLTVTKLLKHAETIAVDIPDEADALVRSGKADAWAAPRPPLLEYAARLPGARVLDERYGANLQALAVAKDKTARLDYLSEFVENAKASGLLQRAIERAGERGIEVAPQDSAILTGSIPKRP